MTIKAIENKILRIKKQIVGLEAMRPGSLSKQFNVCGNPTCKCKDPKKPKKHGPYYNLSYSFGGKSKTQFIRPGFAKEIDLETKNFRKFKELSQQWITLEIEKSNLILQQKIQKMDQKIEV